MLCSDAVAVMLSPRAIAVLDVDGPRLITIGGVDAPKTSNHARTALDDANNKMSAARAGSILSGLGRTCVVRYATTDVTCQPRFVSPSATSVSARSPCTRSTLPDPAGNW